MLNLAHFDHDWSTFPQSYSSYCLTRNYCMRQIMDPKNASRFHFLNAITFLYLATIHLCIILFFNLYSTISANSLYSLNILVNLSPLIAILRRYFWFTNFTYSPFSLRSLASRTFIYSPFQALSIRNSPLDF